MMILVQVLNLIALAVISLIVIALIKNRFLAWLISALFSLYMLMQMASLYISGCFIDYKFYLHCTYNEIIEMRAFFLLQFLLCLLVFIGLCVLLKWAAKRIRAMSLYARKRYRYTAFIVAVIVMCLPGGIVSCLIDTAQILTAKDLDFAVCLRKLGMRDYVTPDDILAHKGKNIIVLSLESFEKGFLSDKKASLTPHLRSLAQEWTYYTMKETRGSNWTSGSLYTSLTGVPAFFKGHGNSYFQKSYDSKITALSHVLQKAGYRVTYMVGDAGYSGTEDMLKALQIQDIKDKRNFSQTHELVNGTVHDLDLFTEAKQFLRSKKNSQKPFALFISTISTHFPHGLYDHRMAGIVPPRDNQLEFMLSAVDYMVGDFIAYLKENGFLANTSIYIYPDHLKLGSLRTLRGTGKRSLYLITNSPADTIGRATSETLYQLDLPGIILSGAGIRHNARFLTDYIQGDKNQFIVDNKQLLTALNMSGLERHNIWTGDLKVEKTKTQGISVTYGDNEVTIPADTARRQVTRLLFSKERRYLGNDYSNIGAYQIPSPKLNVNIYIKDNNLFAYLTQGAKTPILKSGTTKISFSQRDLELLAAVPTTPIMEHVTWESNETIAVVAEPNRAFTDYGIDLPYNITQGCIEVSYSTSGGAAPWVLIREDAGTDSRVAIHCQLPVTDEPKTICLPFTRHLENPLLYFRNISSKGTVRIFHYKLTALGSDNGTRFSRKSKHAEAYSTDTSRFIAHAGGLIDGHTYTNSLEALNNSYRKGFRLFELDIIQTTDGKYVAAHDWDHWAKITRYQGDVPVNEATFLNTKIFGKYTPLNIERINAWFASHPKAILVTDKVNNPNEFCSLFLDKDRLMMELFSLKAIRQAQAIGVKAVLLSGNVFDKLGMCKLAALKSLGVSHIAVSRRRIPRHPELFQQLKANGIRAYVFHVNAEQGKDEQYVVNYEMDYIYGMYHVRG